MPYTVVVTLKHWHCLLLRGVTACSWLTEVTEVKTESNCYKMVGGKMTE